MKEMERYRVAIGLVVVLFTAFPAFAQIAITTAAELQMYSLSGNRTFSK